MSRSPALVLLAILQLGCTTEAPPSGKDVVVVAGQGAEKALDPQGTEQPTAQPTGHVANTADFDRFAFACCATPSATTLVGAYVDLSEKMAADDEAGAGAALTALGAAASAAALDQVLPEPGRTQAEAIATGTAGLVGKPMADVREALASLSVTVISFARDNKGGEAKLTSAFCPMAPGHWLQRDAPIRNPYYGAEMLACGTLEDVAEVE